MQNNAEIVKALNSLKEDIEFTRLGIPGYRRPKKSDSAETKFLAGLMNGGYMINEPALQSAASTIDLAISRIDDQGEAFQSAKDLVGVLKSTFNTCAKEKSEKKYNGLQKIFMSGAIADNKRLQREYEGYAKTSDKIMKMFQ